MNPTIERLREDATAAFQAAVAAVQPSALIPKAVRHDSGRVTVWGEEIPAVEGRRVVMALGKAGPALADAWLGVLPGWADHLLVLAPHSVPVSDRVSANADVLRGAHPYPDEHGERSTRKVLETAASLGQEDVLVVLLSGGSSALLAAGEEPLTLDDLRSTTKTMMEAGAAINQINAVRRQLLAAGGGGLGRAAAPARIVTLVVSDVLGDPLADIGSGPTVPSATTAADALGVLGGLGLVGDVPPAVVALLRSRVEIAEDQSWVERGRVQILANNRTAVEAAAAFLADRGYVTLEHPGTMEGEASDRGKMLAAFGTAFRSGPPTAFVVGGETTVTVRGDGIGGRNHELALAAAFDLDGPAPCVVLSAGTDGIDGLTTAAGAVVDPTTIARIRTAGVDPEAALENNDSGTALAAAADAIVTGPTGTNVCDIAIVLSHG